MRNKASDKQLRGIRLADVLKKRELDQALNAKEFAVVAGICYSTARSWFRSPGFPAFRGVVFWQDFVRWRTHQKEMPKTMVPISDTPVTSSTLKLANLPPKAARILREA